MSTTTKTSGSETVEPDLYRSGRLKRARARRRRFAAYLIGAALLVAVAFLSDWETIRKSYLDAERAREMFPDVLTKALKNTLVYTAFSFSIGAVLGLVAALLRLSTIRTYRWAAAVYIEIFRGLPALLTIMFIALIAPIAFGFKYPEIMGVPTGGIAALSLVAGAYLAETIRAGIEAVPKGQVEAARSLGMTNAQAMRFVVIPQAFRVVIPPLTNELVLLLKDTSLLAFIGTTDATRELTQFGRAKAADFNGTSLVVAGALYLVITIPLTRLVAVLERRFKAAR